MRAGPLGLRLFLEGIEVPVVSAQTTANPGQPAMASIQIVPTDAVLELKPRTLVHLFFLDPDISDSMADARLAQKRAQAKNLAESMAAAQEKSKTESVYGIAGFESMNQALADDKYLLLYIGEVVGLTFSKTPMTRSVVLQCLDLSSYWDICYQWFADWSVNGTALTDKSHIFVGANSGLFDNIASGTRWVVSNILLTPPRSPFYSECKGLLGGIISLIETIGGLRQAVRAEKGLRGLSDFFTIADRRYNFLGMVGAVEADKTSASIYRGYAFRNWLENGMSSLGNLVSMRDLIRHVCQYTFNDVYPNPAAYYAPPQRKEITTTGALVGGSSAIGKCVRAGYEHITTAKLLLLEMGGMEQGASTQEKYTSVPDLLLDYSGVPKPAQSFNSRLQQVIEEIKAAIVEVEDAINSSNDQGKKTAAAGLMKSRNALGRLSDKLENERSLRSDFESQVSALVNVTTLVRLADEAASALMLLTKTTTSKQTFFSGGHLMNQLVLPETFFLPPPTCNVIFPDQYTEFQYSRNFLREVTRLSCQGGLGILGKGDTRLLGRYYFAPTIKDANGNSLVSTQRHGARVLLPHEVHSGIIPKFEWVTDGHRWAVDAAQAGGVTSVPYIQRLANFQFFFHRWAARSVTLTTKFDPYLVLGLPALVLDRSAPSDAALLEMKHVIGRAILPTQYLGKIASLTHYVDQSGGRTQVVMVNCRTHRGLDDEFLGVLQQGSVALYESESSASTATFSPVGLVTNDDLKVPHRPYYKTDDAVGVDQVSIYSNLLYAVAPLLYGKKSLTTSRLGVVGAVTETEGMNRTAGETVTAEAAGWAVGRYRASEGEIWADPSARPGVFYGTKVVEGEETYGQKLEEKQDRIGILRGVALKPGEEPIITEGGRATGLTVEGVGRVLSVKCEGIEIVSDAVKKDIGLSQYDQNLRVPEGWFGSNSARSYESLTGGAGGITYWFIPKKITIKYASSRMVRAKGTGAGNTIALEDAMLPGWYGRSIWGSANIGKMVYQPLLGCGSVTDDNNIRQLAVDIEAKMTGVKASDLYDASKERTLELAIDSLAILYRDIKEKQLNVHDFISQYARRDIATLPQIMGYQDAEGQVVPGFHTYAFGDYNVGAVVGVEGAGKAGADPLVGLFDQKSGAFAFPTEYRGGGKVSSTDQKTGIPAFFDPRGNSRARVRMYMAELNLSRGLKG